MELISKDLSNARLLAWVVTWTALKPWFVADAYPWMTLQGYYEDAEDGDDKEEEDDEDA